MKKLFTLITTLWISTVSFAQISNYCDFETGGTKTVHFFQYNGKLDSMAANPSTVGINTSMMCGKYIRDTARYDNIKMYADNHFDDVSAFASVAATAKFTMKVYSTMPAGSRIDIQFGHNYYNTYPEGIHSEYSATTNLVKQWETLTFNYKTVQGGTFPYPGSINKVIILFRPDSNAQDTIWFDDPMGPAATPVGIQERGNASTFKVSQNTPNPAKDYTTIKLELNTPGHVKIDLFDLLGKKVATVSDREMNSGSNTVTLNTENIPNGAYFYTVKKDGVSETMKMIVSK